MPRVLPSNLELQEEAQKQMRQIITHYLRSSPATVLEHEVDLISFAMRRRQVAAMTVTPE